LTDHKTNTHLCFRKILPLYNNHQQLWHWSSFFFSMGTSQQVN